MTVYDAIVFIMICWWLR